MSWFGTDLVALGCILGGAAVGGAATLAMADGGGHADRRCGVEAMAVSPRIAISHGGEARAIVVTPEVRVHSLRDCMAEVDGVVEIQLEAELGREMEARIQFEEAMRQVEEARLRVVVEKLEGGGN